MQDYLTNRFNDARWYIGGGDGLNAIVYDSNDLEGDGPNGHGMVCQDAVIEDAALIAASPDLLRVAKTLCEYADLGRLVVEKVNADYALLDEAIDDARAAIAKAEGREAPTNDQPPSFYRTWFKDCATGNHQCYDDNQPCGCWCKDCNDLTEPRCPRCNSILEKGACPDYQDCVPLTEGRKE